MLFRGNAEATIRKALLQRGYIKGIIGLPPNLFYGTGIPACIVVLDKEDAQARTGVFMIDASKGFMKDGTKNRLRSQDIHKIVDVFTKQTEIERYSRMVPMSEIADPKNDFNLNIPRYIDSSEPEDIQDLHAHLHGGIPDRDLDALSRLLGCLPAAPLAALQAQPTRLQRPRRRREPRSSRAVLDCARVPEVRRRGPRASSTTGTPPTDQSRQRSTADTSPATSSRRSATTCSPASSPCRLLDEYDVYEQLMTYWHEIMHDDVFLVMNEGWVDAATTTHRPSRTRTASSPRLRTS